MIRQYDVFQNPGASTRAKVPYIVVLQSHLFEALPTVIVAPLMRIEHRELGRSRGSLAAYEDDIRRAVDRLFTGF